jgi:hypothetical protein
MGSDAGGAQEVDEAQDAPKHNGPQGSLTAAAGSDGVLALDTTMVTLAMASLVTSGPAAGDPATLTGSTAGAPPSPPHMEAATTLTVTNDNIVEAPKVNMGHPGLRASRTVSLSEVMGTAHFSLNQAHDVLHRKREDINEEWMCLSVWVSLLKRWMTSEKEKVEARQKRLNVMEVLYSRRQAVANKLDTPTQKLLHDAKDLYATAKAHDNATIKQQEDLNTQAVAMAQWEQAVAEHELKLREREE